MKSVVLKEHLKEVIGEEKVKAALFYTFNFDTVFFENYLLPLFLPNTNFTDNQIANSILWRQYQKELPPITVYCDFHAKGTTAPQLGYEIRTIDIKKSSNRKACFHPKLSLILLGDGRLIIINGSNNLTDDGWCRNIEAASIFTIKNGEDSFPREFKDSLWDFMYKVKELYMKDASYTPSELILESFFRQRVYMKEQYNNNFINSLQNNFWEIIKQYKIENNNLEFDEVEVISPYFSPGLNTLKKLKEVTEIPNIKCLIPYQGINEVAITKNLFNQMEESGIVWCRPSSPFQGKGYRFNHSKVYRFKGKDFMFTIVGSYNFTEAAFDGIKNTGNVESAIVFKEPAGNWESYLIGDSERKNLTWVSETPDEEKIDQKRKDAPFLEFILNWGKQSLIYLNYDKINATFTINKKKFNIDKNKYEFPLDEGTTDYLSDNSLITVKFNNTIFYYYPLHIGIDFKPLSSSLTRLNDLELLKIWDQLDKKYESDYFTMRLADYINSITNEAGDLESNKNIEIKSTLNTMASHLSGLINLEKKIFRKPKTKAQEKQLDERIKYYLFTDNLDTLVGYRKLLKNLLMEGKLFNAFYWLLLNIIETNFYKKVKKSWVKKYKYNYVYNSNLVALEKEYTNARKALVRNESYKISRKHLDWAKKMLLEN